MQTPPVWFSESEDSKVSDALSHLAATQGLDNHLLYQVVYWLSISKLSKIWVVHLGVTLSKIK